MADISSYITQRSFITDVIKKNTSVVDGIGYGGTEPDYSSLYIDNTTIGNEAFASSDIYYPGANAGLKEIFSSVTANNRFSKSIAYTRADYYALEKAELATLGKLVNYHEQAVKAMIVIPS